MSRKRVNKGPRFDGTAEWDRSRQRLNAGAVLLAACAFSAGSPVLAQDVAEAARQEQTRKDKQAKRLKHVYTDEDLKRKRILTREDRELVAAKKRHGSTPASGPPAEMDAEALENLPLGDVARMFRAQKELDAAMRAAEYHLTVDDTVLASPRPMIAFVMPRPAEMNAAIHAMPVAPTFSGMAAPVIQSGFSVPRSPAAPAALMSEPVETKRLKANAAGANFGFCAPKPVVPQRANVTVTPTPVFADVAMKAAEGLPLGTASMSAMQPPVNTVRANPVASRSASRSVVVKAGDSLWKLAQALLGDGHRWKEIAAANPGIANPTHIVPGMTLNVAGTLPQAPLTSSTPESPKVLVHKGDSLWKIAQTKLGSGGFWGCIAKANPMILDANRIYAGQLLDLPMDCGTEHE